MTVTLLAFPQVFWKIHYDQLWDPFFPPLIFILFGPTDFIFSAAREKFWPDELICSNSPAAMLVKNHFY